MRSFDGRSETDDQTKNFNPRSQVAYPYEIHDNAHLGGLYTLFAESPQARLEWEAKLTEAIGSRKVLQESNKVFEVETLSVDTSLVHPLREGTTLLWTGDGDFTGQVTCSVPFSTPH